MSAAILTPEKPSAAADARNRLVLVVEDSDDVRLLWAESLADAGYRVLEANDGEQAIAMALIHRPRVIIMDMSMPNVDGWEATRRIREVFGEREIAILAVSALDEIDGRAAAFRSGCDGFIAKPTTATDVLAVVRSFTHAPD